MLDEQLMGYLGLVREFPDYEYELKFEVKPYKSVGEFWNSNRYCRSDMPHQSETVISHYCGDLVVVQRIAQNGRYVLSYEKKLFELKRKGRSEKISFGLDGEDWVLKRKEKVEPAELSDIIKAVQSEKFEGSVLKRVDYDYVMDKESGRVFELAYAQMDKLRPVVAQLEVEYVGICKNASKRRKPHDERRLVSDLIDLGNSLVDVVPTRKNKRDYVR